MFIACFETTRQAV